MINAPIGGPDIIQIQNISPAVQKAQPDTGSDFRQAFESAKGSVSKADDSTKVNRTEGTGAGGKDSGAADQTANDSKIKQNSKDISADKKESISNDNDVKESVKTDDAGKNVTENTGASDETAFDTAEISKIAEKVMLDIAALLGITPEELNGFLQEMGIEAADLMNAGNINILVADVKGGGDMISLAADADLMELANTINQTVAEAEGKIAELAQEIPADTVREVFEDSLAKVAVPAEKITDDINGKAEQLNAAADTDISAADNGNVTVTDALTVQKPDAAAEDGKDAADEKHGAEDNREYHDTAAFSRTEITPDMEVRPEDVLKADESLRAYGSDTAEVVDQIMEHMKAQVKIDMGSLEMVLHPASLGNVSVNIASNSGNLTAQFTVQNEAVKEAIEAQIVIFKENLEQQGVKVEAVEVSVASHGFEENLEQGNDQNDAQDDERERLRKETRNIDLGAYGDETPEDLDEAEAVTVDMMRSDGNRMNYRV